MCHTSYEMFVLLFLTSGGQVICTLVPNIWGYVCYVWTRHFSLEIIAVDEGTVLLQSRPLSWVEDYTGMLAADIRKWFRIIWAQSLNAQNFIILFTMFQSQRAFFGQHNTNTSSGHSCSFTWVGLIHFCDHLLELQVGLSLAQFLHHSLQLHYVYKIQPNMVILWSSQRVLSQSNGYSFHTNWLNIRVVCTKSTHRCHQSYFHQTPWTVLWERERHW